MAKKGKRVRRKRPYKRKASSGKLKTAAASRLVKAAASKQKVTIRLTEEQFAELMRNFRPEAGSFNPAAPFQIDFIAGERGTARLPVASCAFWGDTCCV